MVAVPQLERSSVFSHTLVSALGLWQCCEEKLLDAKEVFLLPFFEFGCREIFDRFFSELHFLVSALSFLPGLPCTMVKLVSNQPQSTVTSSSSSPFSSTVSFLLWGGVCLGKRTNLVVTSECRRVIAVSLRHETTGQFFAFLSGNGVFRPSGLSWKCVPAEVWLLIFLRT